MSDLTAKIVITAQDLTQKAINGVKSGLDGLGTSSDKASTKTDKLGKESAQTAKQQDTLKKSTDSLNASTKKHAGILASTTAKIVAFGATYLTLNKLKDGFLAILSTGGKFETLKVQLEAVMGTVEGGEAAFAWIKDFAKNTPLQLDGVTKAFVKMKALGLDPMDGTMQKLTDASSKMGGGQEKLEGIILAVGQAWTKGKLQAEEANQLIERGIPVWDLMSKALGKTTAELQDMSAKGQLTRKEIKLLIDEIGKSSEGAAAAQMDTWAGLISNLGDTWTKFLNSIAESGALDYFKQQLEDLLTKTKEMAADGSLQKWAKAISDAIVSVGSAVKSTVVFITEYSGAIVALGTAYAGLKFAGMIAGLASIRTAFVASTVATTAATVASRGFAVALALNPITLFIGAMAALVVGANEVVNSFREKAAASKDLEKAQAELIVSNLEIRQSILDRIEADKAAAAASKDYDAQIQTAIENGNKLNNSYSESYQAALDLAEAQKTLTDETGNTSEAIKKLSDEALSDLLTKIDTVNATDVFVGGGWDDLKNGLLDEQFSRIGLSFDEIIGSATETGIQGAAAFESIATSAGLTADQLAKVATKLVETAKTGKDLELVTASFKEMGVEIDTHPELIAAIVKKIKEVGGSLEGIPQKWLEIASATDKAVASSSAYADSIKMAAQQQEHFNGVLADEAAQRAILAKATRDQAAAQKELKASRSYTSSHGFSEAGSAAYGSLSPSGIKDLEILISDQNAANARGNSGRVQLDIEKVVIGLAAAQASAEKAATEQTTVLKTMSNTLERRGNVTVNLDGREIATSLARAGLTSR